MGACSSVSQRRSHWHSLYGAVCTGDVPRVRRLLSAGRVDPGAHDSHVFHAAVSRNRVEIVELLLEDGRADPRSHSSQALCVAAGLGQADVVQALLRDGRADPRARDSESLRNAVHDGDGVVVRLLLDDARADPTACDSMVIRAALHNKDLAVLHLLLADGRADPTTRNSAALHWCARASTRVRDFLQPVDAVWAVLGEGDDRLDSAAASTAMFCFEALVVLLQDGRADASVLSRAELHPADWPFVCVAVRWQRRRAWLLACARV
jgi:hypothetical protein